MNIVSCGNEKGYLISKEEVDGKLKEAIPFLEDKEQIEINEINDDGFVSIRYTEEKAKKIDEDVFQEGNEETIVITHSKFEEILKIDISKICSYISIYQKKENGLYDRINFSFTKPQNNLYYYFEKETYFHDKDVSITPLKED